MRGGSHAYFERVQHLPDGPLHLDDFLCWPESLLDDLFMVLDGEDPRAGDLRKSRLLSCLCTGVIVHTDFSGKQCVEMVFRMLGLAASSRTASFHDEAATLLADTSFPWLLLYRACDNSALCRQVTRGGKFPPTHLIPDLNARLPADMRSKLDRLRPSLKAPRADRLKAYERMYAYLEENLDRAFGRDKLCQCLMHPGAMCPTAWQDVAAPSMLERPLTVAAAGSVCLAWSTFGKREKLAHWSAESWMIWVLEQRRRGLDLVWHENSNNFDVELFIKGMSPAYIVITVVTGPEDLGWPARRRRRFSCAIRLASLVWLGPLDDASYQDLTTTTTNKQKTKLLSGPLQETVLQEVRDRLQHLGWHRFGSEHHKGAPSSCHQRPESGPC